MRSIGGTDTNTQQPAGHYLRTGDSAFGLSVVRDN
jgi:hypothetical protein